MIGCDKCSGWYHTKCDGVTDHMLDLLDNKDTPWLSFFVGIMHGLMYI